MKKTIHLCLLVCFMSNLAPLMASPPSAQTYIAINDCVEEISYSAETHNYLLPFSEYRLWTSPNHAVIFRVYSTPQRKLETLSTKPGNVYSCAQPHFSDPLWQDAVNDGAFRLFMLRKNTTGYVALPVDEVIDFEIKGNTMRYQAPSLNFTFNFEQNYDPGTDLRHNTYQGGLVFHTHSIHDFVNPCFSIRSFDASLVNYTDYTFSMKDGLVSVSREDETVNRIPATQIELPGQPFSEYFIASAKPDKPTKASEVSYTSKSIKAADKTNELAKPLSKSDKPLAADKTMVARTATTAKDDYTIPVTYYGNKNASAPARPLKQTIVHTVKSGETLIGIARQYNTSASAIIVENQLSDDRLYVKQPLTIPFFRDYKAQSIVNAGPEIPAEYDTNTYVVVQGDNLYRISIRFGTTVEKLMTANQLRNTDLSIGMKLKIE